MNHKTATVIGATGLIGSHLVRLLSDDEHFSAVNIISRRPLNLSAQKIKVYVIDFSDPEAFEKAIAGSESVFVAVGTTQSKVKGDKEAYRKVDYDIPVNAARLSADAGTNNFVLVSSVGANSKSNNFYLNLKGEVEDEVAKAAIPSVSIFRPSLLLGQRNESRFGESFAQLSAPLFSFLIPSVYKPVSGENVAKAMLTVSKERNPGVKVYHYTEIMRLCWERK
ncbi:MAG: NAD(P)H-binding protein [Ignavibacteriaceae bacterium]|nr:NAD(P)H-binding protein [Ignavibacteriaceae bacterium]